MSSTEYYLLSPEEVADQLNSSLHNGLASDEATSRNAIHGKNEFRKSERTPLWKIIIRQILNFMSFVLVGAIVLSLVVKQWADAIVIAIILLINTSIGATQEYKSEKTMEGLLKMAQPTATVIRDQQQKDVSSSDLVPGDIVILKEGDKVPADLRLFKTVGLECDEAILTGESIPVEKTILSLHPESESDRVNQPNETVPLGDRTNCAFMGTTVTKGKGKGIVFATGKATEIGKIAESLATVKKIQTAFEKNVDRLGKTLIAVSVVSIGLVLLAGWGWGTFDPYPEGLETSISTAVAIIPEGLATVATLVLTIGMRRMVKKNVIVRRMGAIESLGSITNVCTDKTGTLTQGIMTANRLWVIGDQMYSIIETNGIDPEKGVMKGDDGIISKENLNENSKLGIMIGSLCNSSSISKDETGRWVGVGSPTEVALVVLGVRFGLDRQNLGEEWDFSLEFPFDSTIKRMSAVYSHQNKEKETVDKYLFVKGATERIIPLCTSVALSDSQVPLTSDHEELIMQHNETLAREGLRVLALCYRRLEDENSNENAKREELEKELVFVGLVGIQDPPREAVPGAIAICHRAGIVVHMVTGDHPDTARAIAKEIGIIPAGLTPDEEDSLVTTAQKFDSLTANQIQSLPQLPLVIARCSPESKVKMVQALHGQEKYVAMLGDGVNDCPAIKSADVGVAMGINGSEITKESSDIVLTDDDFSSVVAAITEGRRTFDNIKKFLVQMLAGNVAETIILVLSILFSLHPPMQPLHVLWINMVTQTSPALALGLEPASRTVMDKSKRHVDQDYFSKETVTDILIYGVFMGCLTLGDFIILRFGFDTSHRDAQTVTFVSLGFLLLIHSYNCRNLRKPFWAENFWRDYWLHGAFLVGLVSIFLALYVPFLRDDVLKLGTLDWRGWLLVLAGCVFFLAVSELYKCIKKRVFRSKVRKQEV